jgi:uncharacterized protein (UPF0216 family)
MEQNIMKYLIKCSTQRAALWGTISAILNDEQSTSVEEIKMRIVNNIGKMVDKSIMVGDKIEVFVCKDALKILEQERALDEVKDILNLNN